MTISETDRESRLAALEQRMAANSLAGHWQPRQGRPALVPWLWRWNVIEGCLSEAGEVMAIGGAEEANNRRTVQLINPAIADLKATSNTLQMSVQLVNAGEVAECHRHSIAALRFVVEADGTYTAVSGERLDMEPNDLVLTPNWSWHDHANVSNTRAIWLDVLDLHLVKGLGATFQEPFPEGTAQPITKPDGYSNRWLNPIRPRRTAAPDEAPAFNYKWRDTLAVLEQLAAAGESDPSDGVMLRYSDPFTGGPTLPTIDCRVQMLMPGQILLPHRHTGNTIYHVIRGNGATSVGQTLGDNEELSWGEKDCFFVPSWTWHEHRNSSTEPAILFSVTDQPVLETLGLLREETA